MVAGLLLLGSVAGCGGSNSTTPPPPPPPTIGQIYVTKGTGAPVARFKASDNGDVPPQEEMTQLLPRVNSLCIDPLHNRLAGTSFDGTPIVVVIDSASNTTGGLARQISGTSTALFTPGSCALDGTTDLLYVRDTGTGAVAGASVILVFGPASSATGNIAPLHTIVLPFSASNVVVDPANNRLFVGDLSNSTVNVYDNASTLDGAVVPNRTITGPATQLSQSGWLAFESSGHLVVGFNSRVLVFSNAGTINGNVAPSASCTLSSGSFAQFAVSPNAELYVTLFNPEILVYSNIFAASGTITPARTITGPLTDLDSQLPGIPPLIQGVAVDPTR